MTDENKKTNGTSPLTGLFFLFLLGLCSFYPANCIYYNTKAADVREEMRMKASGLNDIEYNRLNEMYWHYKNKARDPWYDSR